MTQSWSRLLVPNEREAYATAPVNSRTFSPVGVSISANGRGVTVAGAKSHFELSMRLAG